MGEEAEAMEGEEAEEDDEEVESAYAAIGQSVKAMTKGFESRGRLGMPALHQLHEAVRALRHAMMLDDAAPALADGGSSGKPGGTNGSSGNVAEQALDLAVRDVFPALLKLHADLANQRFVRERKAADPKQRTKGARVVPHNASPSTPTGSEHKEEKAAAKKVREEKRAAAQAARAAKQALMPWAAERELDDVVGARPLVEAPRFVREAPLHPPEEVRIGLRRGRGEGPGERPDVDVADPRPEVVDG